MMEDNTIQCICGNSFELDQGESKECLCCGRLNKKWGNIQYSGSTASDMYYKFIHEKNWSTEMIPLWSIR